MKVCQSDHLQVSLSPQDISLLPVKRGTSQVSVIRRKSGFSHFKIKAQTSLARHTQHFSKEYLCGILPLANTATKISNMCYLCRNVILYFRKMTVVKLNTPFYTEV